MEHGSDYVVVTRSNLVELGTDYNSEQPYFTFAITCYNDFSIFAAWSV
jgi:hypothetical protein